MGRQLLVAARGLPDPNFAETVILLAEHSSESAMGLVLNRRTEVSVARLFPNLKEAENSRPCVHGGPVSPMGCWRCCADHAASTHRRVIDDVQMIATQEALETQIGAGPTRVASGCTSATPLGQGQLTRDPARRMARLHGRGGRGVDPEPESSGNDRFGDTEERMASALRSTRTDRSRARHAGRNAASVPTAAS